MARHDESRGADQPVSACAPGQPACLLYRASLEQLQRFQEKHLPAGSLWLRLPHPLQDRTAVDLRVIHPRTEAVFLLRGHVFRNDPGDGYWIRFAGADPTLIDAFRRFLTTGREAET